MRTHSENRRRDASMLLLLILLLLLFLRLLSGGPARRVERVRSGLLQRLRTHKKTVHFKQRLAGHTRALTSLAKPPAPHIHIHIAHTIQSRTRVGTYQHMHTKCTQRTQRRSAQSRARNRLHIMDINALCLNHLGYVGLHNLFGYELMRMLSGNVMIICRKILQTLCFPINT